jgi:hypothetical protein
MKNIDLFGYIYLYILSAFLYEWIEQDKHVLSTSTVFQGDKISRGCPLKKTFSGEEEQDLIPFGLVVAFFLQTAWLIWRQKCDIKAFYNLEDCLVPHGWVCPAPCPRLLPWLSGYIKGTIARDFYHFLTSSQCLEGPFTIPRFSWLWSNILRTLALESQDKLSAYTCFNLIF